MNELPFARMRFTIALLIALGSVSAAAARNPPTGKLRGTITVKGEVLLPRILGRPPGGPAVLDESLEVDPKTSGVANVFVYMAKPPEGVEIPPAPAAPAIVNFAGGRFVPHVLGVRVDQPITVTNTDAKPQNWHSHPIRNPGLNRPLAPAAFFTFTNGKPERLPVQVTCDILPWMRHYQLVLDHPWFAVTDAEGNFAIDDLPPGHHEFVIWHERVGYLSRKLTAAITAGEVTVVAETYPADRFTAQKDFNGESVQLISIGPFDLSVPDDGRDAALGRRMLLLRLQQKIETVHRICGLNGEQRRKLELAGNGDVERLLDRINELRRTYGTVRDMPERLKEFVERDALPIHASFNGGLFGNDSLFAKVFKATLTADQKALYERDREGSPVDRPGKPR